MLLDAASLYFRAFYGVKEDVVAPDGTPVNAVRGSDFDDSITGGLAGITVGALVVYFIAMPLLMNFFMMP